MSFSKNELLALHGLLHETAKYIDEEADTDLDSGYELYKESNVKPHYIHKSKSEHEEAVQTLSTAIVNSLSKEQYSESRAMLE